jgi:hypothetical protein
VADEPELSRRPLAIKLAWWNRAILDVLGLAGLGAGAAAVFITHLEAGPVALIAAGLLLLLIGMGGRMPSRLKVGDNEAAWEIEREAVQVFVERVAEEAPVERRPELIDALSDLAENAPQAAAPALSGLAYEELIRRMIYKNFPEISALDPPPPSYPAPRRDVYYAFVDDSDDDEGTDASLSDISGRRLIIQIKASTRIPTEEVIENFHKSRIHPSGPPRPTGFLLIHKRPIGPTQIERLRHHHIHHVTVRGPEDEGKLVSSIRRAFTEAQEPPMK